MEYNSASRKEDPDETAFIDKIKDEFHARTEEGQNKQRWIEPEHLDSMPLLIQAAFAVCMVICCVSGAGGTLMVLGDAVGLW